MNKMVEGNELIARFMGMVQGKDRGFDGRWVKHWFDGQGQVTGLRHEYLEFDSNWNWLMSVVEKIEQWLPEGYNVLIELRSCQIELPGLDISGYSEDSKIEAVWNAVCEFIIWYNEQHPSSL